MEFESKKNEVLPNRLNALGRHVLIELYDCPTQLLDEVVQIEKLLRQAAIEMGATIINSNFHHFSPYGVSGVVIIQESHLTIHTWPEYNYAAIDCFTCGEEVDPLVAFNFLNKAFEAKRHSLTQLKRGIYDQVGHVEKLLNDRVEKTPKPNKQNKRQVWFTDRDENVAISLRHKGDLLFREQSDIQLVEVYDTYEYGRMLAIDKVIMCTERDEHGYHEMIVHVPMMSNWGNIKKVLVIGGGDGGCIRELLRYDYLVSVTMVEIDEIVVKAVKEHLPTLSSAFNHPKLNLKFEDGIEYLKKAADNQFDLIIIDAPDPIGPAEGLFELEFFQNAYRCLSTNGILVGQSESPYYNEMAFKDCIAYLSQIFGKDKVDCFLTFIPTYTSGMWSFSFASKGEVKPIVSTKIQNQLSNFVKTEQLGYYNGDVHRAAFALPNFVKKIIEK